MATAESLGRSGGQASASLLSELADLAYFEVDADRNVVALSPAMEALTGFKAEDVLGRSCLRLHRCDECLKSCGVFDWGTVRDKRIELYAADGSVLLVSKSGQVFFDEEGQVNGAIEVIKPLDARDARAAPSASVTRGPVDSDEAAEADRIRSALTEARYRRTEAARALGMSRSTLWRKMKQYGL